jgi:hypothetical protein
MKESGASPKDIRGAINAKLKEYGIKVLDPSQTVDAS